MAHDFQVTIDCSDPHVLADWWAETLGWNVEPSNSDFIRKMISEGHAAEADTTTYKGELVWKTGAAIRHPDSPPDGPPRRVLFNQVPEDKTVKNRVHLDVWVGHDNLEASRDKLVERGATFLYEERQGPHNWLTMQDPAGNEFCIS